MGRQVLGTRMVYRETFLQIQRRLLQHLIRKSQTHGSLMYQNTHHHMWWVKAKHPFRLRDASQDRQPEIQSSPVSEDFQTVMWQTNKDCRFQIFILTNSHVSNVRLLEDKIQNWGKYLFTISYGSHAVDQRSGDGWVSGWSKIFLFYHRNSWARLWGTRRETCFSTEQNHPEYSLQEKKVSLEMKAQKEDRFLRGRQIAYLIYEYFRSLEPVIPSRVMQTYWLLFFEMMIFRNPIQNGTEFDCRWHKSHLMTSWKDCTN